MNQLFTISKSGKIFRNFNPVPIDISQVREQADILVETLSERNILTPKEQTDHLFSDEEKIDPNKHYSIKCLQQWVQMMAAEGVIDINDLDHQLAAISLLTGRDSKFRFSESVESGLTIECAGPIVIPPSVHRRLMIDYYLRLRDTPKLLSVKKLQERLDVSRSTISKLMQHANMPHYKLGRAVRFCPRTIDRWLDENA